MGAYHESLASYRAKENKIIASIRKHTEIYKIKPFLPLRPFKTFSTLWVFGRVFLIAISAEGNYFYGVSQTMHFALSHEKALKSVKSPRHESV